MLIVWDTVINSTKNADFTGISKHQNIIKNYAMRHKYRKNVKKLTKVVYNQINIILFSNEIIYKKYGQTDIQNSIKDTF